MPVHAFDVGDAPGVVVVEMGVFFQRDGLFHFVERLAFTGSGQNALV